MLRRFGHGHSLALGILLTLALERHALLAAILVFAAGVTLGRSWARIREAAPKLVEAAQRVLYPKPTQGPNLPLAYKTYENKVVSVG